MNPIVSLITPTHRTDKLYRLYLSINAQTDKRFEWIVIPNNNADVTILPKEPWIKIIPYPDDNIAIGALKNFGFMQGQGELLAEVDHDDELMPHCVETLIANKDKADFLYSNNLVLNSNNEPYVWGPGYGWVITDFNYKNSSYKINIAFPPYPTNFAWQWWAPNHIRVWNKEFYRKIGGHDINLKICDDGDLMCRTMIEGSIYHINDVLYIYYLHSENSHANVHLQNEIQERVPRLYSKYILKMAQAWSKRNNFYILAQEDIFNFSIDNNKAGIVFLQNLYLLNSPERYIKKAFDALVPGGLLVISNPNFIENSPTITENKLRFWDRNRSLISVKGINFMGSHLNSIDNTTILYLFKYVPNLHIGRGSIKYN